MIPYRQTTPYTTAASSLLTLLHHFNPKIKLSRKNEFSIWKKTVNLPTRASSLYGLAILAHQARLLPKIIVEKKEYDFPDYRFYHYKKTDMELAQFSSQLYLKKAERLGIPIEENTFTLADVKKELKKDNLLLLRLNTRPIRHQKNLSQYLLIYRYQNKHFQLVDPTLGALSVPEEVMQEAFLTLETKKHRNHCMIVFEKMAPNYSSL